MIIDHAASHKGLYKSFGGEQWLVTKRFTSPAWAGAGEEFGSKLGMGVGG